uniref:Uncharacterized protein n=1 Tax=Rhipicephalus zambeziensis TaxID=60191 RepID=A0A224Y704_9ACAR
MPFQSNVTCFYVVITHPPSLPPLPPFSSKLVREHSFFSPLIVTSCYDSFNFCYLLVIVVYFLTFSSTFTFAATRRDAFEAQTALRMFVRIEFVTSEPSAATFFCFIIFFKSGFLCALG